MILLPSNIIPNDQKIKEIVDISIKDIALLYNLSIGLDIYFHERKSNCFSAIVCIFSPLSRKSFQVFDIQKKDSYIKMQNFYRKFNKKILQINKSNLWKL